jgi:divalent metal cation (Fe/Co/Zn/Cd) transporter
MIAAVDRRALALHGRRLEYFTITWNSLEGLIAVAAGVLVGSISLVGFGVDSFIEVTSGAALLWRMSTDADEQNRERREKLTLRIVGASFIAREGPEESIVGIVLACVSLVVMPILSRAKRRVGKALNSAAMQADAKQTEFCTYLSAILLGGLLLNLVWGVWWADAVAALVMVPIIAKEGIEGLQGDPCCH